MAPSRHAFRRVDQIRFKTNQPRIRHERLDGNLVADMVHVVICALREEDFP